MKIEAILSTVVLIGACCWAKDWRVGAILGPICCFLCYTYGHIDGSHEVRKKFYKIMHL